MFRPPGEGTHPVLMSAHPYGKEDLPAPVRAVVFEPSPQYRLLPQSATVRFSALTTWEAPGSC